MPGAAITWEERIMVDPGSVGDWMQASLMAAALGGLAAAGGWALRREAGGPALPARLEATGGQDTSRRTTKRVPASAKASP
jgi:hypothetical protein